MRQEERSYLRKKELAKGLMRLMSRKSFQKITVQDIACECNVNRYTFYYHFKDVYDLLTWAFQEEALSLIKKNENCLTWRDGFGLMLESVRKNRATFQCAMNGLGEEALRKMFHTEVSQLMSDFLSEVQQKYQVSEEYRTFLCSFYTMAICSTVIEWVRDGCVLSNEELLSYLHPILSTRFEEVYVRAQEQGL